MRILIDFTQIPLMRTGVGVYADHLVAELSSILAPDDELYVLVQDDEHALRTQAGDGSRVQFETIPSRVFRNRVALLAYEQVGLPRLLRRLRIDVVHSLHYTFPFISSAARVVTIHDLTFFRWPQMHTLGRRIFFRPFTRAALRQAEAVVFVSESTRQDAERLVANVRQQRTVVPHGVSDEGFVRPEEDAIRRDLDTLNVAAPYVLFVGTVEPRKNAVRLIEAFDGIAGEFPGLRLVIAGKMGWHREEFERAISRAEFRDRILRLGYVTVEQRQSLLAGAAALVYPSLYEGFGLPVLEAMALGVPVITSNVSSLPEVAGDAAVLVDPTSVAEIAGAMRAVLTDEAMRAKMAQAGVERARGFRWREMAEKTYAAYRAAWRAD